MAVVDPGDFVLLVSDEVADLPLRAVSIILYTRDYLDLPCAPVRGEQAGPLDGCQYIGQQCGSYLMFH